MYRDTNPAIPALDRCRHVRSPRDQRWARKDACDLRYRSKAELNLRRLTDDEREAADVFFPLALGIAAGYSRRFPRLADDFESHAAIILLLCVQNFDPGLLDDLSTYIRYRVNRSMVELLGRRRSGAPIDPIDPELCSREDDPGRALRESDDFERATRSLSSREREFLGLIYRDGLTQAEAGDRFGLGRAASNRLHKTCLEFVANTPR